MQWVVVVVAVVEGEERMEIVRRKRSALTETSAAQLLPLLYQFSIMKKLTIGNKITAKLKKDAETR